MDSIKRDDIRDKFNQLHEIALLFRRRLQCANTNNREFIIKELKEVEAQADILHKEWDNLNN